MSRVFRITPKRTKRTNGTVLTPDMVSLSPHANIPLLWCRRDPGAIHALVPIRLQTRQLLQV